jgi:hypothetical protein
MRMVAHIYPRPQQELGAGNCLVKVPTHYSLQRQCFCGRTCIRGFLLCVINAWAYGTLQKKSIWTASEPGRAWDSRVQTVAEKGGVDAMQPNTRTSLTVLGQTAPLQRKHCWLHFASITMYVCETKRVIPPRNEALLKAPVHLCHFC